MSDDDILLRESVNLEDVMREVKALREEVRGYFAGRVSEKERARLRDAVESARDGLRRMGLVDE